MTDVKRHILRTASEIAMGRYMRAPDHPAAQGTGAAEPAAEASASDDAGASDADFAAFERRVKGGADPGNDDGHEGGEANPDDGDGDGDDLDPEDGEHAPRKGKTAKDRIDELTRNMREREREAEYWRGVAEGRNKPETGNDAEGANAADEDVMPDPADYDYGEADPKYLVDLALHTTRKEIAEARLREVVEANLRRVEDDWQSKTTAAKEKYPDFDDKVIATAAKGEWPCSPVVSLGIKTSEVGADIAYHLATNVEEAKRIHALTPIEQARELGKLEGKFAKDPAPRGKIATDAPEPAPVRARGAGGQFAVDDDTTDFAAFEAKHRLKSGRKS